MSEAPSTAVTDRSAAEEPNTGMNVLLGAVVTVVTAPLLPFAAIVGGGAAGYLQRGDLRDGAKVGALSGAVAAIPALLLAWLVVGFLLTGLDFAFALTSVFATFLLALLFAYLVGAGALGGVLGAYLREEL